MHARMVSTSPDSPVAEAAAEMVREKVGSALVMQGSFLAGILTERDVLKAAASGSDLTTVPVSDWMTKDPQAAGPDTPVEEAAQIMLLNGFRHLPIVDGRRVHGVSASVTCSPPGSADRLSRAARRANRLVRRKPHLQASARDVDRDPGQRPVWNRPIATQARARGARRARARACGTR